MTPNNPVYLGDSVYADVYTDHMVVLYTDNGYGPLHQIFLEPEVVLAFLRWLASQGLIDRFMKECKNERPE